MFVYDITFSTTNYEKQLDSLKMFSFCAYYKVKDMYLLFQTCIFFDNEKVLNSVITNSVITNIVVMKGGSFCINELIPLYGCLLRG